MIEQEKKIEQLPEKEDAIVEGDVKPVIKHLVISGGGIIVYPYHMILRESNKAGFWNIKNIKSIWATSAGSINAVVLSLNYEWEFIDDYFLKRPWQNIFEIKIDTFLSLFSQRGIFDETHFKQIWIPLFKGKDIDIDINFKDFFEFNGIELHVFATEINSGFSQDVDFSYKTHPEWKVLDAVYCSCCLPVLFKPLIIDNLCYMDGGIFNNYPLVHCLKYIGAENEKEILGLNRNVKKHIDLNVINEQTNLTDTLFILLNKLTERINNANIVKITNQINVEFEPSSLNSIFQTISTQEKRQELYDLGKKIWEEYSQNNLLDPL